jgi:hypothetical protein
MLFTDAYFSSVYVVDKKYRGPLLQGAIEIEEANIGLATRCPTSDC